MPTDFVSKPLVIQHKISDRDRELYTLPLTLLPPRTLSQSFRDSGTRSLYRVSRSAKLMRGNMPDRTCLAGSICGVPGGPFQISRRRIRMASRRTGVPPAHLAPRPCADCLDRLAGTPIPRKPRFEKMQNVLCAISRPQGKQVVVRDRKRTSPANSNKSRIADFRKIIGRTL
jgi:hypothetical protein